MAGMIPSFVVRWASLAALIPGLVFDVASGSTSFHDGRPICPDTLFEIGSITRSRRR
ncbi:MAG: hypothetical protein ACREFT_08555 [Acetobacteraceae bacterium]